MRPLMIRIGLAMAVGGLAVGAALASPAPRLREGEVAVLVEIVGSERQPEARRAQAIRQLENTDLRTHMPLLRRLLREERSLDVRLAAACTLAAHGDLKSPKDLLLATAYDAERTPSCSRSDVLLALARTGDPAGEMHLERALQRPAPADEPFYYADVCRALGMLNTPGARRLLLAALAANTPEVRYAAVSRVAGLAANPKQRWPEAAESLRYSARLDADEKVAEQAASALLWSGVDGPGFFRLLESDQDPKVRARAARVMNRHYLTPARLQRLRAALAREQDPGVREAMETTLSGQKMGAR